MDAQKRTYQANYCLCPPEGGRTRTSFRSHLSGYSDGSIQIKDVFKSKVHTDWVTDCRYVRLDHKRYIASIAWDGGVRIWRAEAPFDLISLTQVKCAPIWIHGSKGVYHLVASNYALHPFPLPFPTRLNIKKVIAAKQRLSWQAHMDTYQRTFLPFLQKLISHSPIHASKSVTAFCKLANQRLLFGFAGGTVEIWNQKKRIRRITLEGMVTSFLVEDNWIACAHGKSVSIWSSMRNEHLRTIEFDRLIWHLAPDMRGLVTDLYYAKRFLKEEFGNWFHAVSSTGEVYVVTSSYSHKPILSKQKVDVVRVKIQALRTRANTDPQVKVSITPRKSTYPW